MRLNSHWIAVSGFDLAMIISAGVITAAATEAGKTEPEKLESDPGNQGPSAPGKDQKKESAGSEASDEVQALETPIIELQNKGKLGFRKIVRCRSVEGFGAYSPL